MEEATYRDLVENASDIIYAHDLEGRFTWVNRACERVTGYTREETLRLRIWDLVVPEYRTVMEKDLSGEMQTFEVEVLAKDGRRIPLELKSRLVYRGQMPVGVQGIARDITDRRRAAEAMRESEERYALAALGSNDGLWDWNLRSNRIFFSGRWKEQIGARDSEVGDDPDDWFKRVHPDDREHLLGDLSLHLEGRAPHLEVEHRVRHLDGTEVFATASIGVAVGSRAYAHPEELLRDADTAMYRAKDLGRARHAVFDPAMHALARAQLQLDTDLRRAIEREELRLRYQPVVSLRSGQIVGCEALIVWEHPTRGTIPPGDFIPTAEETGLIVPIGRWALLQACIDAKAWNEARPRDSAIFVSVNLSARQLVRAELLEDVRGALLGSGLEARRLKLEVTESAIMEHAGSAALLLNQLKALTVGLLLDDFGTGYSSLSYLHNFRFDTLKIDRSFVARLEQAGKEAEIVRTIVSLARALQMDVVAEGVENASQLKQLQALEVHSAQGYWFSRALDAKAFLELLEARKAFPLPGTPRLTDAG